MLVDYHLHTTKYSRHAEGEIKEYLDRAEALGMEEVCFTEHISREYVPEEVRSSIEWTWMQLGELPGYLQDVAEAAAGSSLRVRRGVEADFIGGYEENLRRFLKQHDELDFVLGTIHFMPQYDMEYVTAVKDDPERFFLTYFDYVQKAVESKVFDSMAHIHLGWHGLPWPSGEGRKRVEDALANVVAAAKKSDMCLEVNTRAFDYDMQGTPEKYHLYLQRISDYQVPITFGSDSHRPTEVGRNFPHALSVLKDFGIKEVATFKKRVRRLEPLGLVKRGDLHD